MTKTFRTSCKEVRLKDHELIWALFERAVSLAFPSRKKIPFGYTRKDVLLIDLGVTVAAVALKSGLEVITSRTCRRNN
ncbi:unnamed protein product [Victoria cruziana]